MHREQHDTRDAAQPAPESGDSEHVAVHELRRAEIIAMTPAERFALMDSLCRQVTRLAADARRVR